MQPTYTPEAEAYRSKVQAFLARELPSNWGGIGKLEGDELHQFVAHWRVVLHKDRYLAPGWPAEYGGGGFSALEQVITAEEFARAGVPTGGYNDVFGIQMLGNTLLQWGSEEQKAYYLPRILSNADVWCQGYSEPNAGSDLSNIGLRGELDGDQWVLNGQKIWTSAGHLADHIFTLARTDPDLPRHKGISFLLVDMRQPGVEVRPIRMISGESEFNEVFYTDATCPKDNVVGGVNNGWAVAMTLLGYERGEAAATLPIRFQGELDRLMIMAKDRGVANDPVIRQRLAWCYSKVQMMRFLGMRTLTKFMQGHHPAPMARSSSSTGANITRSSPSSRWTSWVSMVSRQPVVRHRAPFKPTMVAPRTQPGRGRVCSSTRVLALFMPAQAKSSATSSARWCSAFPRNLSRCRIADDLAEGGVGSARAPTVVAYGDSSDAAHGGTRVVPACSVSAATQRRLFTVPARHPVRRSRPSSGSHRCRQLSVVVSAVEQPR